MNFATIQEVLLAGALGTLREKMMMAPRTRYRTTLANEIERVMLEIERTHRVQAVLPSRTRALLLLPSKPISDAADPVAVAAYVRGLALGTEIDGLVGLVRSTYCPQLMRRFARLVPRVDRELLRNEAIVAEVMQL